MRSYLAAFGRFFVACALCVSGAQAAQLEVGIGAAHFFDYGDGTWYQQALPHHESLRSPAFMLGVTQDITPHLRLHLDAFDLGKAAANSWDVMDTNYDPIRHICLAHCSQLTHFVSSGTLWGIAPMVEWHTSGAWTIGVEAGPWIFHQDWTVVIPNFYSSTGYAPPWPYWSTNGDAIYHSAHGWGLGAVAGATVRHGPWGASLLGFYNQKPFGHMGGDPWPALWRTEAVFLLTYSY